MLVLFSILLLGKSFDNWHSILYIPNTPLTQFYVDSMHGNYVASGVSLRNTNAGDIVISGIPSGATIHKAYLYWTVLTTVLDPSVGDNGIFNGTPIQGTLIGQDDEPCWGATYSQSFMCDVTSLVTGNGTYSLSNFTEGTYREGATLVIIYTHTSEIWRTIVIYQGNTLLIDGGIIGSLDPYLWSIKGFHAEPSVTSAKITYIISDGQNSYNYPDSMFVNNNLVDWNTSESFDGFLWDTRTYDVTSFIPGNSDSIYCRYSMGEVGGGSDCVVLVASIFSVNTEPISVKELAEKYQSIEIYPIPSKDLVNIKYSVNELDNAKIGIYTLDGRLLRLFSLPNTPGVYTIEWDGKDSSGKKVKPGIYFCKLKSNGKSYIKKIILL